MKQSHRKWIQAAAALLSNPHWNGFRTGLVNRGEGKRLCVPGLNCYSCPGAAGSCPIGSLQAVLGSRGKNFSFYVLGLLMLFGVTMGRLVCGFLCPFGWFQELLHKIPGKKCRVPEKIDRPLRWVKYLILLVFVVLMPVFCTNALGIGAPAFCKYICPAGTLEGGIPMLLANSTLRKAAGWLFSWKFLLLVLTVIGAVLISRPFCKYVCPLGAFYGLFNRFSLYRMTLEQDKCIGCHKCDRVCQMNLRVPEQLDSAECIRCGACREVCPTGAISSGISLKQPVPAHPKTEKT